MTPAIVISRYNSTDPAARRLHVREAMAVCRWAVAQGYAPVCSLLHLADVNDPPEDTAGEVRDRVMAYSQALARMVGAAGGVAILPRWYEWTSGMEEDNDAYHWACDCNKINRLFPKFAEVEPYMPRDLVAQVQAAVDQLYMEGDSQNQLMAIWFYSGMAPTESLYVEGNNTGITPTEVTP